MSETVKIPLFPQRATNLNNFDRDISMMIDGVIGVDAVTGYGQVMNPFEIWYEFPDGQEAVIDHFRYYNRYDMPEDKAMEIYGITAEDSARPSPDGGWKRSLLARIHRHTQLDYMNLPLLKPFRPKYLVMKVFAQGKGQSLPDELEIWGTCKSDYQEPELKPVQAKPFRQMLGVNTFEWELMQNKEFPWVADKVYEPRWKPMQHLTNFRHYWGWKSLEVEEGIWNFQPSRMGNWGYDEFYKRCSSDGRIIWPTIKGLPDWIMKTWKEGEWHHEGAPRKGGSDPLDPFAWEAYARTCFQVVARYGSNKKVDPALVLGKTWDGKQYHDESPKVIGLGYLKHIEILNEADAWWWNGRPGFLLPDEYGTLLSAVWDGHMGKLGPGVGIKFADPDIKVIVAGSAQPTVDWHKGLARWWKEFRGDELPVHAWNYHCYSSTYNSIEKPWGPDPSDRGQAPERSKAPAAAAAFHWWNQNGGGNREIWITECGYDLAQTSPQEAIKLGNKSPEDVQGDWLARTALLYSAAGHSRMAIYQLYDDNTYGGMFGSSGITDNNQQPRVASNYLAQLGKLLGDYTFDSALPTSGMWERIHKYVKPGAVSRYVGWMGTESDARLIYEETGLTRQFQIRTFDLHKDLQDPVIALLDEFTIELSETPVVWEIIERALITEVNYLPIADAGRDIHVPKAGGKIPLVASGSIDTDGQISGYKWKKVSGPRSGSISNSTKKIASLDNSVPGVYTIQLTIVDDKGGTATDTLKLYVGTEVK